MPLATFPMTVEPIHSTGLMIVKCAALGWRDLFVTDDHGNALPVNHNGAALYSACSGMEH
ncbi:hypothetical protein [Herbaspirillum huttiense]|uniref:Uncharacterized protein n=1 Tax=Herbaspirillum huttiense subsp. lycopersici TaxID=3074428 RepID=A0ABU2EFY7_9BURK|nr:hypothetical protein [Herbaspirillum huttiense]MDR9847048.1 hypothetical protein [Herbaspirillum huttiense SE1]